MMCPTCHGTGEVTDPRPALMGEFCPAELNTGNETFTCLTKGYHDGHPHCGYETIPCQVCWGVGQHVDNCPNITAPHITGPSSRGMDVYWNDDGVWWLGTETPGAPTPEEELAMTFDWMAALDEQLRLGMITPFVRAAWRTAGARINL